MLNQVKRVLQTREHAGRLLADKLYSYKNSDSIVLAVPHGGIPVGLELAKALKLPFEIIFSKRIKHPAHSDLSIGAVSMDEVVLHESTQFIPQNYILHQINLLQKSLKEQFERYYHGQQQTNLKNKNVILVDDVLRETDELLACLKTIRKQRPLEITIAVPVTSSKAAHILMENDVKLFYLFMELLPQTKAGSYFPPVNEEETQALLDSAKEKFFSLL